MIEQSTFTMTPEEVQNYIKIKITVIKRNYNTMFSKLANCLYDIYQVDKSTTSLIISKLNILLENPEHHHITNEFIDKSKSLNINSDTNKHLNSNDAVLKAPKHHEILFANLKVRILCEVQNLMNKRRVST